MCNYFLEIALLSPRLCQFSIYLILPVFPTHFPKSRSTHFTLEQIVRTSNCQINLSPKKQLVKIVFDVTNAPRGLHRRRREFLGDSWFVTEERWNCRCSSSRAVADDPELDGRGLDECVFVFLRFLRSAWRVDFHHLPGRGLICFDVFFYCRNCFETWHALFVRIEETFKFK